MRARVLSSEALRMVAPRMAALEAAMMVKSFPVMPRRTSLENDEPTRRTKGQDEGEEPEGTAEWERT